MVFYPNRTVTEQQERLPPSYQENFHNTQIDRIKIDGEEIMGYFEYSFMEEKTYKEQPVRADDGSIVGLDDMSTFLTPRLIIKYNMMNIADYRKLMKLLKSKNSFMVECYDIVEDKRVIHPMYFAPPQMPIIYQQYLMAMGIREYSIELIGTNSKETTSIQYDYNQSMLGLSFIDFKLATGKLVSKPYLQENFVIGDGTTIAGGSTLVKDYVLQTYNKKLKHWSTSPNGSGGETFADGSVVSFDENIILYAIWGT